MKSMRTIAALAAVLCMSSFADAGRRDHRERGASKCCDCAPTFQPSCCKPTIVRPCHRNVYSYQRSCAKATGCDTGCGPNHSCCPTGAGNGCVNGATSCAAPCATGCAVGATSCAAPCGNMAAPCVAGCAAGANNCAAPCGNGCAVDVGCTAPCSGDDTCCATTCQNAGAIAQLIYESQTACKGSHRSRALKKLGKCGDCACNPEIMSAFIYGLNDSDKKVRKTAAKEIGDQLKNNSCCCSQCVVDALTMALADCDRGVGRKAEKALEQCGYEIVDQNCCKAACDTGCANNGGYSPAAPEMAQAEAPAIAPAPPAEKNDRSSKRSKGEKMSPVSAAKKGLTNLFSLVR